MSFRDTGRPAQPRLAALEASRRDLCDGEVRHSAMSYYQGDVPWPEGHSLRKPEATLRTPDLSPIAPLILVFEESPLAL